MNKVLEEEKSSKSRFGKIKEVILKELKTGTAPEKIALSLTLGAAIGVFPLIGTTMALTALLGFLLRLNPISIQLANYAVYPFQVLLLIPFLQLGASITGAELNLEWAYRFVEGDPSLLWQGLSVSAMYAVLGWGSLVPILGIVSYIAILPAVRKIDKMLKVKKK
ncbi:hypothetical protein CH373_07730 [Leptospira perolatii]|uniref:DUF2062 domain-containing protein n=1 Tax=Leptospira perolatii TaxID=2023191 RepID=A0A2M9ZPV5_9LEPT|nr:DUF2062 domain-containing protein [Leptospira perolatii]PJZ70793.1 hypothetical protein CH360_04590 [Leptospira perolatii]PJZ74001.1 hypothetical protein CH373_07730 [Leptospira perolatii]